MCVRVRGHEREGVYVFVKHIVCVRVYPSVFDLECAAAGVDVGPVQGQLGFLSVLHRLER